MRLLVLHSELGVLRGGGENFTRNLFSAFVERGHQVEAAFLADYRGKYPIPLPASIKPIPIPGWWSRNAGQRIFSSLRHYLPCRDKIRAAWDRVQEAVSWRTIDWHDRRFQRRIERDFVHMWGGFDVVYVHASPLLASRVAQHRPTILRLPGPTAVDMGPMLRAVHAVCANGDALVRIRRFLGNHAIELPIGIDRDRFTPEGSSIRSQLGWKEHDRIVGYVGRLTHLKGVDLLATAFQEVSHTMPSAKLLIIGSGSEEQFIRSILAKEIACGSAHIEFDVNHEQLPNWYRAMDLFVMPSRYENFSNAMLEAMACGVPFLGSDVGGNRILSETGGGGLFEPASVASLSSRMRQLLQNLTELRSRGRQGAAYVRSCCSWNASAERLEEIIVSRLGVKT